MQACDRDQAVAPEMAAPRRQTGMRHAQTNQSNAKGHSARQYFQQLLKIDKFI
jgi:hypothetical protein